MISRFMGLFHNVSSYKRKLTETLCIFVLVPLILVAILALISLVRKNEAQTKEVLDQTKLSYQNSINNAADNLYEQVRYIINYNTLNKLLSRNEELNVAQMLDYSTEITDVMNSIFYKINGTNVNIYTNNPYVYEMRYIEKINEEDILKYEELELNGAIQYSVIDNGKRYLVAKKKYRSFSNTSFFNVVELRVPFENIFEMLSLEESETFTIYIDSAKETITPINRCSEKEMVYAERYLQGKKTIFIKCTSYTTSYLQGTFYTFIDMRAGLKSIIMAGMFLGAVFIIILIGIVFIVTYVVEKLTKRLTDMISSINSEDLKYKDGLLCEQYDEFEIIQHRLVELKDDLRKENDKLLKLEFESMNYKISPHFLYNNLSVIKWKCDDEVIDNVVDMLVAYYRNMFQKNQSFNTVKFETDNLNIYVELLRFSYEKDFEYEVHIDEKLVHYKIPSNIIQPLIENAFIHGINNNKAIFGKIVLLVVKENNCVAIEVQDNGNCFLNGSKKEMSSVAVIDKRIKLYFGKDYGLSYTQRNGATVARIELPYLKGMNTNEFNCG